jgi:hypothetical protein
MRLYDPHLGCPEILAVGRTGYDTRRRMGHLGWLMTDRHARFVPKAGFVKVLPDDHVAAILADPRGRRAR